MVLHEHALSSLRSALQVRSLCVAVHSRTRWRTAGRCVAGRCVAGRCVRQVYSQSQTQSLCRLTTPRSVCPLACPRKSLGHLRRAMLAIERVPAEPPPPPRARDQASAAQRESNEQQESNATQRSKAHECKSGVVGGGCSPLTWMFSMVAPPAFGFVLAVDCAVDGDGDLLRVEGDGGVAFVFPSSRISLASKSAAAAPPSSLA